MVIESEIINMLAKANEIQNRREITVGNVYYNAYRGGLGIVGLRIGNSKVFTSLNYPIRKDKYGYIWIPSQKQLQDIYYRDCRKIGIKNLKKDYNKLEITIASLIALQTFLQEMAKIGIYFVNYYEIWIAFIMYELYNKVWIHNEWKLYKVTYPSTKNQKKKKSNKKPKKRKKKKE